MRLCEGILQLLTCISQQKSVSEMKGIHERGLGGCTIVRRTCDGGLAGLLGETIEERQVSLAKSRRCYPLDFLY